MNVCLSNILLLWKHDKILYAYLLFSQELSLGGTLACQDTDSTLTETLARMLNAGQDANQDTNQNANRDAR